MGAANLRCPVCQRDVDTWLTRDGLVRKHSRPTTIPSGLASTPCSGTGQEPQPAETPEWIRKRFGL